MDLTGIARHCTLLVMQLKSAQYEIPKAQARLQRQPEQHKRELFYGAINAPAAVNVPTDADATEPYKSHLRFVSMVIVANPMAI